MMCFIPPEPLVWLSSGIAQVALGSLSALARGWIRLHCAISSGPCLALPTPGFSVCLAHESASGAIEMPCVPVYATSSFSFPPSGPALPHPSPEGRASQTRTHKHGDTHTHTDTHTWTHTHTDTQTRHTSSASAHVRTHTHTWTQRQDTLVLPRRLHPNTLVSSLLTMMYLGEAFFVSLLVFPYFERVLAITSWDVFSALSVSRLL